MLARQIVRPGCSEARPRLLKRNDTGSSWSEKHGYVQLDFSCSLD